MTRRGVRPWQRMARCRLQGCRPNRRLGATPCRSDGQAARRVGLAALLLGLCLSLPANVAALDARLSTETTAAGEPFSLILTDDAPLPADVDLGPLNVDFRVIDRRQAQSVTTVDGRRLERHELILTLLPRRTGALSVPSIAVGDGRTPALPVTVAGSTSPDAQLVPAPATAPPPAAADAAPQRIGVGAEVTPTRAVVDQELLLTVQVRSPDGPPQGHLPTPQVGAARLRLLGTSRTQSPDGDHVLTQRFSVFPQQAGRLSITGLGFDAWQLAGGAPVRHRADPVAVDVEAPPAEAAAEPWLPARLLTLSEAGPTEVRIAPGQGLERLVTIRAEGLPAERLPAIALRIPFELRVRDDPPRLWNEVADDGIVGYRAERVLISAEAPGSYVLPGAAIDWWDTQAETVRTATLPDWTLTVAPFASTDRRPAARCERDQERSATAPQGAGDTPRKPAPEPAQPALPEAQRGWGVLLAGGMGLLVAVPLLWLGLRRLRRRPAPARGTDMGSSAQAPEPTPPAADQNSQTLVAAVRQAYGNEDAAAARTALLAWAAVIWPERPPGNLSQLMLRLPPPLRDELKLLDKTFYGPGDGTWATRPVPDQLAAFQGSPWAASTDANVDSTAPA